MRYDKINPALFKINRVRLLPTLKPNAVAVFTSNDPMPTNADGTMGFRQNNDIFYLSGIDQEETFLILAPDFPDERFREILFVRETNEHIAVWEGNKLSKEEAKEVSGIEKVYWSHQFENIFSMLAFESEHIYLNENEHRAGKIANKEDRLIQSLKTKFPLHSFLRLAPLIQKLRLIKDEIEIDLIKKAINITDKMFHRALKSTKIGKWEFEIEADITHELLLNRSRFHAYQPIVASGKNACILHYIENNAQCQDGDLLLLDIGAEYGNYNADLSRTIPVSGRFSTRQKQVYQAVLRIFEQAKKNIIAGKRLDENQQFVGQLMEKELVDLGLLTTKEIQENPFNGNNPALKKYFPHGASHFLGLDVHDVGSRYSGFEPGMLLTCEPGIYIKEESLGIRLENNILITENGNIDLMQHIPIEIEEIEDLMNGGRSSILLDTFHK